MYEYKRCPFCGQFPETRFCVTGMNMDFGDMVDFTVVCPECGTSKTVRMKGKRNAFGFEEVEKAMKEVNNAWNMRWDSGGDS